jgi:three-Cys-motif partner protein
VPPAIWDLEPHTRAKHQLLDRYLGGYFPILSRHERKIIFIDAFAGPGVYAGGEPGSPRLALERLLDHHHMKSMAGTEFVFLFNEKDPARFASLEKVVADLKAERGGWPANVRLMVENQNFTDLADDIIKSLQGENMAPAFAFIDPFGYKDVPMATIAELVQFRKCELFIYFDFNSANRFGTAGNVDQHFEALYGTDKFKDAPLAGDPNRGPYLHDLYESQLKAICKFPFVRSFEMIGKNGHTNNYLFYCTRHLKGLALMKEAMWKVAPGGDFRFSDLTAGQEMLMSPDADFEQLMDKLADHFSGRTVSYQTIEDYVVEHTHFAPSHIKRSTLKPLQAAGRIDAVGQKKKGTFPDRVRVIFP